MDNDNAVIDRRSAWVKRAVVTWLGLALYWPVIKIGTLQFRLDYPLLFVFLLWLATERRWERSAVNSLLVALFFACLIVIGTLWGLRLGYPIGAALFGFLKFFVTVVVWNQILSYVSVFWVVRFVSILGIPAAVLAVMQVGVPAFAANLTLRWYSSGARTAPISLLGGGESIRRAVSVFESPVYAGVAFLILAISAIVIALTAYRKTEVIAFSVIALVYVIAGLATGSSTFILGVAIIGLTWVIWMVISGRVSRRILLVLFAVVLLVPLAGWLYVQFWASEALRSEIEYQIDKIMSGKVLSSRFGDAGILREALSRWPEYWLVGLGGTRPSYFIGDSLYVVIWTRTGLTGVVTFLGLIVFLVSSVARHRGMSELSFGLCTMMVAVAAAGVGAPVLSIPRFSEVIAFVFAGSWSYAGTGLQSIVQSRTEGSEL